MTTRGETTHPHILAEGTVDCPECGTEWQFIAMTGADGAQALIEEVISRLSGPVSEARVLMGGRDFNTSPLRVQVFRSPEPTEPHDKQCPKTCGGGNQTYLLAFMVLDGRLGPGALKENGGPVYLRQNRVTAVQGMDFRPLAW